MKFKEYIMMSLRDLSKRKGRTILTALGITIGTLLIVTMVGLGSGLEEFMLKTVNSEGNSKIVAIQPYKYFTEEDSLNMDMSTFEDDYFKALDDNLLNELKDTNRTSDICAHINTSVSKVKIDGKNFEGFVSCTGYSNSESIYPEWFMKEKREKEKDENLNALVAGRLFDVDKNEVMIGEKILSDLNLTSDDVLNKELEVTVDEAQGVKLKPLVKKFTIVGVVDKRVNGSDEITMSVKDAGEIKGYSTLQKDYIKNKGYDSVQVAVKEVSDVEPVSEKIKDLDYYYTSSVDMAKQFESSFGGITLAFAVLGIVVLVVAAIGIINTMSMAVLERTKSIGVMKSVGADSTAIKTIFLVQSSIIGFIGGLVGIVLATGINALIQMGINAYVEKQGFTVAISIGLPWYWILAILAFAVIIALISGIYPASKAAKLDPIEALRR